MKAMKAMKVLVAALVVGGVPATLSAQSTPDLVVQVGLFNHRFDGSFVGSAFDTGPDLDSTLSVNQCRAGAGNGDRQMPDATDIWRFTGKVVSADRERAVVQLNWRRTLAQGKKTAGNEASVQLTLRNGESVTLDHAGPTCPTMNITFEARYGERPFGGVRTSGVTAPMSGIVRGSMTSNGVMAGSTGITPGGLDEPAGSNQDKGIPSTRVFNVDLWIVHAIPGQADQVTHSQLRINENGGQFSLAPIRVNAAAGASTVQIAGSLLVVVANGSEERLVFRTTRRVTPPTTENAPDPSRARFGSSLVVNRLPGPDDVLSFEMPPIQVGSETLPDRFSIRLKVTPR
jgi:hypothetical protein